jgi:pilus assembly protein CpaB
MRILRGLKFSRLAKRKFVALLAGAVVVLGVYQYNQMSIREKINPIDVVYTRVDIPPQTRITPEMLMVRKGVPASSIPPNAYIRLEDVVGKWTLDGFGLSKNSLLYRDKVVPQEEMPNAPILNLKEDEFAFSLLVDLERSSGNAILPGAYVDLWFLAMVEEGDTGTSSGNSKIVRKPLFAKMFEKVRVTSVKDSKAQNVFSPVDYTNQHQQNGQEQQNKSTADPKTMAKLYTLAVNEQQLDYLNRAKQLGTVIPVASGTSYEDIQKSVVQAHENETDEEIKTSDLVEINGILKWIDERSFSLDHTKQDTKLEGQR